ncbi:Vi polysaccharide biosynthesis protein VipB/TviC, partial [candidate division MSBL1 archaeon SCGC-AAA261D19]
MSKLNNILVTGGAGFIGSNLVDKLIANGQEVTVLDNLSTGNFENLRQHINEPRFHFVKGDIRNVKTVEEATNKIDVIVHEAAITSVPRSVRCP